MNTQLKKGDRCKYDNVYATVEKVFAENDIEISYRDSNGHIVIESVTLERITRIPTHGERMQKIVDAAFDAENRLKDDETVQFRVGDMAEFARYHCKLRDELDALRAFFHTHSKGFTLVSEKIEKLLKGEA